TVPRRGYIFTPSVTTPVLEFPREPGPSPVQTTPRPKRKLIVAALALPAIAIVVALLLTLRRPPKQETIYEQITNFSSSAVSPALSPDGRMLAFIRSGDWFLSRGEIWVKLLPNGEPIQVTHDPHQKYGVSFSPDGSRIAYTIRDS